MKKVKVWECKIVVPEDAKFPPGFDFPPRAAAIKAITDAGVTVIGCASGWGGTLTREEQEAFEAQAAQPYPDVYFAGLADISEDIAH